MTDPIDAAGLLADIAGEQFKQMDTERQQFGERMAEQQKTIDASANRIMERLAFRRNPNAQQNSQPQYSKEVLDVANILTAYPKLVPVVNGVIAKLMKAMEVAFNEAAATYAPPTNGGGP